MFMGARYCPGITVLNEGVYECTGTAPEEVGTSLLGSMVSGNSDGASTLRSFV